MNSYTPIAAPNALKMLQSRTEEQATRVTYREPNSSYATNVPQKQLFIENEYDSRKVPVTIGESARDASNDTRIDASHFSYTPFYTNSGSAVSHISEKISTSPFNFSSVDKQRESLNSLNNDKQEFNSEHHNSLTQDLSHDRQGSIKGLRDTSDLAISQTEEETKAIERYDSRHLIAEPLRTEEPKWKRNEAFIVTRKEVQAMPLIDWKPQFVAGQKRLYQDLNSNQPSYSNLQRPLN